MERLKLAAFDADDLGVISAHMQDAIIRTRDLQYLRKAGNFAILANRFAWEATPSSPIGDYRRRRTGLRFARVVEARSHRILRDEKDGVLSLLAIGFEAGEAPSGTLVLDFSGGGVLRLAVECIEAQMEDLGPAWDTQNLPTHDR